MRSMEDAPPMKQPPSPRNVVLQLRVWLQGIRPPIWRRLLVPSSATFGALHHAIQEAMPWLDYHLHEFRVHGNRVGVPDPEDMSREPLLDERVVALHQLLAEEKASWTYAYDFGDGWVHDIVVEQVVPRERGAPYPRCIGGARRAPPEDCGGIGGYEEMLVALVNPTTEQHQELLQWQGSEFGRFDPEAFDLAAADARVRRSRRRCGPRCGAHA